MLDISEMGWTLGETKLLASDYTASQPLVRSVNFCGAGRNLTNLKQVVIRNHGLEDYVHPFPGRASSNLVLRDVCLINSTIDMRWASWNLFRDCRFHGCVIRGFSAWSMQFDNCHFVKTKVVVEDALMGPRKDNRGFSGKWRFRDCEFEAFTDWTVYLGFRSRLCSFDNVVFDTKEPGRHVPILLHPQTDLDWAEHYFFTFRSANEPSGTMDDLLERRLQPLV